MKTQQPVLPYSLDTYSAISLDDIWDMKIGEGHVWISTMMLKGAYFSQFTQWGNFAMSCLIVVGITLSFICVFIKELQESTYSYTDGTIFGQI